MSATLATTQGCRTSSTPYHRRAFRAVRPSAETVAKPSQTRPMPTRTYPLDGPLDLVRTLRPARPRDRRSTHALRPPAGPGARPGRRTGRRPWPSSVGGDRLTAEAWGPGRRRALDGVPRAGRARRPGRCVSASHHRLVDQLARRFPGVRLTRTGAVLESLVPAILEQKVTGDEARRAWRGLVRRLRRAGARPARASASASRRPAATLAALPYYAFHPLGVERRRADTDPPRRRARRPGSRRSSTCRSRRPTRG